MCYLSCRSNENRERLRAMTYERVLPRDLFNEANLIKCIGKIVLMIEDCDVNDLQYHYDGEEFYINQNPYDGSTHISNIEFWTVGKENNRQVFFTRSLNSRAPWPITACVGDDEFDVFSKDGEFILDLPDELFNDEKE